MIPNIVAQVGAHIGLQTNMWYTVVVWHRLAEGGRMHETVYPDLSWSEAVDIVLAEFYGRRPGWALGEGWSQPPLPFD